MIGQHCQYDLTSKRVSCSVQQLARMLRARSRIFLGHSGCLRSFSRSLSPPFPLNLAMPALSPLICCVLMATRALHWYSFDFLSVSLDEPVWCSAPTGSPGLQRWSKHQVSEDSGEGGWPSFGLTLCSFPSPFTGDEAMIDQTSRPRTQLLHLYHSMLR